MGNRPASIYKATDKPAFTRREYMKGIPQSKISIFDMGDNKGQFEIEVSLVSKEAAQITNHAMEAARIACNRYLHKMTGPTGYHFKIRVFPHQVLRENKMATGAGADRVQDGMRKSFGKSIGFAARVAKNQKICTVKTDATNFFIAKDALKRADRKFPMKCAIVVDKGKELLKF
ncbi:MAG: 50S ribosomal protein L16 [Candidatus Hydrothermarchaeales archaeon]